MSNLGKIEHVNNLYEDIGAQYLNEELSDVTFIVESKHFYCHKIIWASRSQHFKTLLYGDFKESNQSEIELKEITAKAFDLLTSYIYTSKMDLTCIESTEEVFDVYKMVHLFGFGNIETEVVPVKYLQEIVDKFNVCVISEKALLFKIEALETVCNKCIDDNAEEIVESEYFRELSMSLLKKTLSRDTFVVEEVVIFRAIENWIEHNRPTSEELPGVLELVRLSLISSEDLVNILRPSRRFPDSKLLDAIKTRSNQEKCGEIKYRGYSNLEENSAVILHGSESKVNNQALKGRTCAVIWNWVANTQPNNRNQVVISLEKPFIVNCITIHLTENENTGYPSYNPINCSKLEKSFLILETSKDKTIWFSVNNFQKYSSNFWCMIRFPKTVAKHFRITFYGESSEICKYLNFAQCSNELPSTN